MILLVSAVILLFLKHWFSIYTSSKGPHPSVEARGLNWYICIQVILNWSRSFYTFTDFFTDFYPTEKSRLRIGFCGKIMTQSSFQLLPLFRWEAGGEGEGEKSTRSTLPKGSRIHFRRERITYQYKCVGI